MHLSFVAAVVFAEEGVGGCFFFVEVLAALAALAAEVVLFAKDRSSPFCLPKMF